MVLSAVERNKARKGGVGQAGLGSRRAHSQRGSACLCQDTNEPEIHPRAPQGLESSGRQCPGELTAILSQEAEAAQLWEPPATLCQGWGVSKQVWEP